MLRTIILEDEPEILQSLEFIINSYCSQIYHLGSAGSLSQGAEIVKKFRPDLVLLDIKFPDGTAFDFLASLGNIDFKIVFITAFNEFAVDAFRYNAIDYLLKPVSAEDLLAAVQKAEELDNREKYQIKLNLLLKTVREQDKMPEKIVLHSKADFHIIEIKDIIFIEADRNRTLFHMRNSNRISSSVPFSEYVALLSKGRFLKVHRGYMINLDEVKSFLKKEGGYVIMNNGTRIPVSGTYRDDLLDLLG